MQTFSASDLAVTYLRPDVREQIAFASGFSFCNQSTKLSIGILFNA